MADGPEPLCGPGIFEDTDLGTSFKSYRVEGAGSPGKLPSSTRCERFNHLSCWTQVFRGRRIRARRGGIRIQRSGRRRRDRGRESMARVADPVDSVFPRVVRSHAAARGGTGWERVPRRSANWPSRSTWRSLVRPASADSRRLRPRQLDEVRPGPHVPPASTPSAAEGGGRLARPATSAVGTPASISSTSYLLKLKEKRK